MQDSSDYPDGSEFMPEREGWSAFDVRVIFVHFSKALLTVIKHGSGNPRKSEHVNLPVLPGWPLIWGRGAGSRGSVDFVQDI